jgi:Ca-activated chloride channel family protein
MARRCCVQRGSSGEKSGRPDNCFGRSARKRLFLLSPRHLNPIFAVLFAFLLAVPFAWAQIGEEADVHIIPRTRTDPPKPASTVDPALKTYTKPIVKDVDVVLVPVTITDPMDRLVTGLEKQHFEIFEAGHKQEIRHFSCEDAPISLGVIFDLSGSMADKIDKSREAVVEFFKTANPQDEFFVVTFSDRPELLQDFTPHIEDVQSKLVYVAPKGKTALLDAIYLGMNRMRAAKHERKALLIISDGGDNHSRYTEAEIKSRVKESDIQIYAIGLFDRAPRTPEEQLGPMLLNQITSVTGGRAFTIDNPNELADVATKIGMELRNQYMLAYRPTNPVHDGKWRKIKVKLLPPKGLPPLRVYAKTGYYAPQE